MASANDLSSRWNLCVAAEAPPSGAPFAAEGEGLFRGLGGAAAAAAAAADPPAAVLFSTTHPAWAADAPGGPHPSPIVSVVAVGASRGLGVPETEASSTMPSSKIPPTIGRADWMESLTLTCLDRARHHKKRRRLQRVQQRALHIGEAPPQLGALAGATRARLTYVEAESNGDDDDSDATGAIHGVASKRRRRWSQPDEDLNDRYGRDPSLIMAARWTIQDALLEQQPPPHGTGALEPLHRGANGSHRGPGPHQSQYVMTNEEWLDLLRQVQEELCDDDGASVEYYDPLEQSNNDSEEKDDDDRIERAVEAERAEQAYWDEQAAEWLVEGGGGGGEPGDMWGSPLETGAQGPAAFEHEYEEDDGDDDDGSEPVLCPVCHEAFLEFVASEGDDAAGSMLPRGSAAGSLVCPNHLDGSCTMRVDRVPPPRRAALTAMRRLLCELCHVHAATTASSSGCTHAPDVEVTTSDQVLHASCATCGWNQSVPLASWFS